MSDENPIEDAGAAVLDTNEPPDVFPNNEDPATDENSRSDDGVKTDSESAEGTFDEALLLRAEQAGFTQDDIDRLATTDAVIASLDALDRKFPDASQRDENVRSADRRDESRNAGEDQSGGGEFDVKPFKPDWDVESLEPEVVKAFDGLNKHYSDHIKNLNQQLQQVTSVVNGQMGDAAERDFDRAIESLGEAYEDVLGKGASEALKNTSAWAVRKKVSDHATILASGYRNTGRRVPPVEQLVVEAARAVLPNKQGQIERSRIKTKLRNPKTGKFAARATGRGTSGRSTGGKKSVKAWDEALGN